MPQIKAVLWNVSNKLATGCRICERE